MDQGTLAGTTKNGAEAIPGWIGWANVLLIPVTAFWLSLYSLPVVLAVFMLTVGFFALGLILAPFLWLFVLACATLLSAALAFLLVKGSQEGRSWGSTAATFCTFSAMISLLAAPLLLRVRSPFPMLVSFFCGASVIWYSSQPWLLRERGSEGPSPDRDPPGGGRSAEFGFMFLGIVVTVLTLCVLAAAGVLTR
jgi:phosphatidylglycerophosphate synthase